MSARTRHSPPARRPRQGESRMSKIERNSVLLFGSYFRLPTSAFRLEVLVRHHLATLDQAMLVRSVVRDRAMYGADVLPHEYIAFLPAGGIAVLRLQLVLEQERQRFFAFPF